MYGITRLLHDNSYSLHSKKTKDICAYVACAYSSLHMVHRPARLAFSNRRDMQDTCAKDTCAYAACACYHGSSTQLDVVGER